MTDAIFWDLDSSLADTRQRHHLSPPRHLIKGLEHPHHLWRDYAMACADDAPMLGPITVMRMSRALGWTNHVVSGRNEEARLLTVKWFAQHDVPWDSLRLHLPTDVEDNGLYKLEQARRLQAEGYNLRLIVEDWPTVANLLEAELGVPVLCVNPRYPDKPMEDHQGAQLDNPTSE